MGIISPYDTVHRAAHESSLSDKTKLTTETDVVLVAVIYLQLARSFESLIVSSTFER